MCGENPNREKHECKRDRKLRRPGIILRCFAIAFSFFFLLFAPDCKSFRVVYLSDRENTVPDIIDEDMRTPYGYD